MTYILNKAQLGGLQSTSYTLFSPSNRFMHATREWNRIFFGRGCMHAKGTYVTLSVNSSLDVASNLAI